MDRGVWGLQSMGSKRVGHAPCHLKSNPPLTESTTYGSLLGRQSLGPHPGPLNQNLSSKIILIKYVNTKSSIAW